MTEIEALQKSIVIWKKRSKGEKVNELCPLCKYNLQQNGERCYINCIVQWDENKKRGCCGSDSPYKQWAGDSTAENAKKVLELLKKTLRMQKKREKNNEKNQ